MIKCPNCGTPNEESYAAYCAECGSPLQTASGGNVNTGAPSQGQSYAPPPQGYAPPQGQGYAPPQYSNQGYGATPNYPPPGAPSGYGQSSANDDYAESGATVAVSPGANRPLTTPIPQREIPTLTVLSGDLKDRVFSLTKSPVVIGRAVESDVVIENEKSISRRHAQLDARDNGYMIEDLNSSNGTFVNGLKINDPNPLKNGDLIRLGKITFLFKSGITVAESPLQYQDTPIASGNMVMGAANADPIPPPPLSSFNPPGFDQSNMTFEGTNEEELPTIVRPLGAVEPASASQNAWSPPPVQTPEQGYASTPSYQDNAPYEASDWPATVEATQPAGSSAPAYEASDWPSTVEAATQPASPTSSGASPAFAEVPQAQAQVANQAEPAPSAQGFFSGRNINAAGWTPQQQLTDAVQSSRYLADHLADASQAARYLIANLNDTLKNLAAEREQLDRLANQHRQDKEELQSHLNTLQTQVNPHGSNRNISTEQYNDLQQLIGQVIAQPKNVDLLLALSQRAELLKDIVQSHQALSEGISRVTNK